MANGIYAVASPSRAASAAALLGCATAAAWIVRILRSRQHDSPRLPTMPSRWIALAIAVAPSLGFFFSARLAFLRVDARLLIVLSWLALAAWMQAVHRSHVAASPTSPRGLRLPHLLTVLWGSVFWLIVVWDLGLDRVVLGTAVPERVLWSFEIWETQPPSQHLFLAWLDRAHFDQRNAYTNHLHPYLLSFYAFVKLVQWTTGAPLVVGRNLTPFAIAAVGSAAFALLLHRSRRLRLEGVGGLLALFLALGLLITEQHFWRSLSLFNYDDIFPLVAHLAALVWASTQPRISSERATGLVASAVIFGLFGWVYAPVVAVSLWICGAYGRRTGAAVPATNRPLATAVLGCVLAGAVTYAIPLWLVSLRHYSVSSSPLLFRSGLDGDTQYFHDMTQAVLRPWCCEPRTLWSLLFPAFVPLAIGLAGPQSRGERYAMTSQATFMAAPYVVSVTVFGQSVSIHPYLYDHLLFLPALHVGLYWMLIAVSRRTRRGPYALACLLALGLLLMSNLTDIAQTVQAALRRQ